MSAPAAASPRTPREELYFQYAKSAFEEPGETEFDDQAEVSISSEGAYVEAWMWVPQDAVELPAQMEFPFGYEQVTL